MSRWQPNDDWRDARIRRQMAAKPRVMPEGLCETGKAMWTKAYSKGGTHQDAWAWQYHEKNCKTCNEATYHDR